MFNLFVQIHIALFREIYFTSKTDEELIIQMKQTIYFDKTKLDGFLEKIDLAKQANPIIFTEYLKKFFLDEYSDFVRELKDVAQANPPIIHIKHTKKISFDTASAYVGYIQEPEQIKALICHMYATIGVMNTFPILYKEETKHLIRAVVPRPDSQFEYSSQSPFVDLAWHVDAAYRPIMRKEQLSPMPDYLVFGIVHPGKDNIPITYAILEDVLNQLDEDEILVGLSPEFSVTNPYSLKETTVSQNVPLLHKNNDGRFYSRITLRGVAGQTPKSVDFCKKISHILGQDQMEKTVFVESGDIVILNNKITMHKRKKFSPSWDGKDRYFLRMYSVKDINQGILPDTSKPWEWY